MEQEKKKYEHKNHENGLINKTATVKDPSGVLKMGNYTKVMGGNRSPEMMWRLQHWGGDVLWTGWFWVAVPQLVLTFSLLGSCTSSSLICSIWGR